MKHRALMAFDENGTLSVICPFCEYAWRMDKDGKRTVVKVNPDTSIKHFGSTGELEIHVANAEQT